MCHFRSECAQFGEGFCVAWSTAGYTVQLALVPCFFALISLLFIFLHRGGCEALISLTRQESALRVPAPGDSSGNSSRARCWFTPCSRSHQSRSSCASSGLMSGLRGAPSLVGGHPRNGTPTDVTGASFTFGVAAAIVSLSTFGFLTFTGIAARRGEPWAAGRSARQARRHKRTRSGRVVSVPEGTHIPPEARVTVGEVVSAAEHDEVDEHSALLAGHEGSVAGGGMRRATDQV